MEGLHACAIELSLAPTSSSNSGSCAYRGHDRFLTSIWLPYWYGELCRFSWGASCSYSRQQQQMTEAAHENDVNLVVRSHGGAYP